MTDSTIHLPSEKDAILAPESIALSTLLVALAMARTALRTEYPDIPNLGEVSEPISNHCIFCAHEIIQRIDSISDLIKLYLRFVQIEIANYPTNCFPF